MALTRQSALVVCTALLLVLAGCGGAGDGGGADGATTAPADLAATPTAADDGDTANTGGDGAGYSTGDSPEAADSVARRQLIRTGTVALRVDDFDAASEELGALVRRHGGYVSDTREQTHTDPVNETTALRWTEGRVVVRVPAGNFSRVFEAAKALGEVRESSSNTRDVTDQLVDIEARLANLRAQRDRLRELYRQANETEDILQVGERLSAVQTEIERLAAQRASLRDRVAMSTITVRMSEPRPDRPAVTATGTAWYEVGLAAAFLDSASGAVTALRALSVLLAYALPYLAVFGVPVAAVGYAWRWRRRRGRGEGEDAAESGATGDDTGDGDAGDGK